MLIIFAANTFMFALHGAEAVSRYTAWKLEVLCGTGSKTGS